MIDENIIREWWRIFKSDEHIVECRILGGRTKGGYSGYFSDVESMIEAIRPYRNLGIYSPVNTIKEGCGGRKQWRHIEEYPEATTSDNDIEGRSWILIDIDPERPSNTNATDEEKAYAREMMVRVGKYLRDMGFSSPVVADSANGYHLYYKVRIRIDDDRNRVVKEFLGALDMMFSDDRAKIDTTVFNPSRIVKVIGTGSHKGADTETRPQRMSRFVKVPYSVECTDVEFLRKVAGEVPHITTASDMIPREAFDIETFLREHGIEVARRTTFAGGEKLVLAECPFNSNHKAPDAALFKMSNGAIGFKCLHASCAHHGFRDFRLHYDPAAYDRRTHDEYRMTNQYYSRGRKPAVVTAVEQEDEGKGHKWKSLSEIRWVDPASVTHIPTGVEKLDTRMMGLALGDLTIMTGLAGAGKSSLIDFIALNVVDRGYKVAVWSGELQDVRFKAWVTQAAAGRNNVRKMPRYENAYYAPKDVAAKICQWLDGKMWLYNNDYGNKWSQIYNDVREAVEEKGIHLIVIDNLMALSLGCYEGDKLEKQTQFVTELKDYAKKKNIHVLLVCHPRKEMGNMLLRMESISGSADLFNACDNVIIAHRAGLDFDNRAKGIFSQRMLTDVAGCDEVLEVAKNRESGAKDYIVGLWYEVESRRFKNRMDEYIVYGWQADDDTDDDDDLPI